MLAFIHSYVPGNRAFTVSLWLLPRPMLHHVNSVNSFLSTCDHPVVIEPIQPCSLWWHCWRGELGVDESRSSSRRATHKAIPWMRQRIFILACQLQSLSCISLGLSIRAIPVRKGSYLLSPYQNKYYQRKRSCNHSTSMIISRAL